MKPMRKYRLSIVVGLWLCATAGCSVMSPQPDRTQWYVLSTVAPKNAAAAPASTSQLSLGLGPIKFPDYLKRPWVVTRASSNRLIVSDEKRWGEPLDRSFESTLSQNLSQLLGTRNIISYPWYGNTRIDYQIEVQVDHFETTEEGQSLLSASWTIRNGRDAAVLANGESVANAPAQGGDPSAALSEDLGEMSRQIAARVTELNQARAKARLSLGARSRDPIEN
jgi:uncharacterized protein